MGREFELKYQADPAVLEALAARYPGAKAIAMETAYYDTPQGDLNRRHWMLRRRLENGVSLCTLKTPLPDGSRGEWETECEEIEAAVPALCQLGAPETLASLGKKGLILRCAARFTRLAVALEGQECTLELALDRGVLLGSGREAPLCEVEVELKQGSEAGCRAFADALAKEFSLEPQPLSKVRRAMEL